MAKIKLEDIQNELALDGWKVISTHYENLLQEMTFECPEGHQVSMPWKKLRTKRECPLCKNNIYTQNEGKIIPKTKGTTRILSLDQSTHVTGYAIFDDNQLISYGTFSAQGNEETDRFVSVKNWFISMVNNWQPQMVSIEGIQYQDEGNGQKMGITVFQTLARLQGILMITCKELKLPFEICPTNTWRHFCGVKGRSRTDRKRSMQMLVKQWYDITVSDDESDAIGIGRYSVNQMKKNTTVSNWET